MCQITIRKLFYYVKIDLIKNPKKKSLSSDQRVCEGILAFLDVFCLVKCEGPSFGAPSFANLQFHVHLLSPGRKNHLLVF